MSELRLVVARFAAMGRWLLSGAHRHRKVMVVGSAVGVPMGATAIGLLYVLTYVWPWSVLIGCEQ